MPAGRQDASQTSSIDASHSQPARVILSCSEAPRDDRFEAIDITLGLRRRLVYGILIRLTPVGDVSGGPEPQRMREPRELWIAFHRGSSMTSPTRLAQRPFSDDRLEQATQARINKQRMLLATLAPGTPDHRLASDTLLVLQDCLHVIVETRELLDAARLRHTPERNDRR